MNRFKRILNLLIVALLMSVLPLAAQDNQAATYNVIAGITSGNIDVTAFGPIHLQVHRGDTVRWLLAGFHNIHMNTQVTILLVPYEQDGTQSVQMNPEVFMPSIQSGGTYTGGITNSGLPLGGPPQSHFELMIDAEPGVYTYFCDVHPGMSGMIEVVADDVEIPSPSEALSAGFDELYTLLNSGFPMIGQASADATNHMHDQSATITFGAGSGLVGNYDFYPNVVVISPGQTVTWTVPADLIPLPIGIGSMPIVPFDQIMNFTPPTADSPPSIVFTELAVNGSLTSGSEVALADSWYSGMLKPGESYTLTFTEPGVYHFTDSGPGSEGAVVVLP